MDVAGAAGGEAFANYAAEIAQYLSSLGLGLEGPSAKDRISFIVPYIISLLPPPSVPAPDADEAPDSDDEHFSLTSSSDNDSDDGAVPGADVLVARGDGQDHISGLAKDLLSNIICRLPTKEAALTTVLSTRWRRVWLETPLLLDDAHLRAADEPRDMAAFRDLRAVSRCVAAHPGPVRAVRITGIPFHPQEYALQRLVSSLAAKNVQDLVIVNRPWPIDMPLPDAILSCASLTRLYIGVWRWPFPDTHSAHPPAFPNLHELGLFHTVIEDKEADALLAHCPKLKILSYAMADNYPSRLRVNSRSLRAVIEWRCSFDGVVIDDAPCLERLLFDSTGDPRPIKIVHAPRLEILGFLDLQLHMLEIGGILIKGGMNVSACAMLPSVKILAVKVQFWLDKEAKMLPTLLRCFPRLQTLHIMSIRNRSPDVVVDTDFWESLASCDCLESHLKTFVHHGFQGQKHELEFSCYIIKNGKALKSHAMVYSDSDVVVKGSDGSSSTDGLVVDEGPMSGSVGEGNASSGGSSGSDDEEVGGSYGSSSSNASSGGSSGSDDEEVGGSYGSSSSNASSGRSSGSDDEEVEGGPTVGEGNKASGGSSGRYMFAYPAFPCWSFQKAIDLSVKDPFYVLGRVIARVNLVENGKPL